jgi:hypothetical protein
MPADRGLVEEKQNLKLWVAEIRRIRYCPKNWRLRVEKIVEVTNEVPQSENSSFEEDSAYANNGNMLYTAYRLSLSDGEETMLALLAPDLHLLIESEAIIEGSLTELREYSLLGCRLF